MHAFCSLYCFNQLMMQHSGFFCSCALSSYGLDTVHYSTSIFEVLQQARCWFRFLCKQAFLCLFYVSQEHMGLKVQLQELQERNSKPRRFFSNSSLHKFIILQVMTNKVILTNNTNSLMQLVVKGIALCPTDKDACVLYVWVDEKEKPSYGRAVVVQTPF
jgi:hypothetical protein